MELYCFLLCVLICGVQSGWNESNEEEYYFRLSDVNLKGVIRLHHKGFLKANIPYYSNCCASFNIKLLVSGDIQPNPGPDNSPTILTSESLKKSRIKYSREELQQHQYGRQAVPLILVLMYGGRSQTWGFRLRNLLIGGAVVDRENKGRKSTESYKASPFQH